MEEQVVLVDAYDSEIGTIGKMDAHSDGGKLHRGISIFVFNKKGELMLQQRADSKYHSGGLWTNTTCGHPLRGESPVATAHRKIVQEMGFDCEMYESFSTTYHADVGNGLSEWEFLHVIFGVYDGEPRLNQDEAKAWKWIRLYALKKDVKKNPSSYSAWLRIILNQVIKHFNEDISLQKRSSSGFGK